MRVGEEFLSKIQKILHRQFRKCNLYKSRRSEDQLGNIWFFLPRSPALFTETPRQGASVVAIPLP